MVPETENSFDPWHVFVREELNDVVLLDFDVLTLFP
jgi:hypothetical protein